jgi:hypothetical protein
MTGLTELTVTLNKERMAKTHIEKTTNMINFFMISTFVLFASPGSRR